MLGKRQGGQIFPWPTCGQLHPSASRGPVGAAGCRGMGCRAFLICITKSALAASLSSPGCAQRGHKASCGPCQLGITQWSSHQELFRSRELLSFPLKPALHFGFRLWFSFIRHITNLRLRLSLDSPLHTSQIGYFPNQLRAEVCSSPLHAVFHVLRF